MTLATGLFASVPALVAVAVAAWVWLAVQLPRTVARSSRPAEQLPAWLRLMLPVAGQFESLLRPLLTQAITSKVMKALARCDLDIALSAEAWVAVRLLSAVLGLLLGWIIAGVLGFPAVQVSLGAALLLWFATGRWLVTLRRRRESSLLKELPAYLDVLTLCVEAGATLTTGMRLAVEKAPLTPLRQVFERVLREIRAGRTRVEALQHVAQVYDVEGLTALASALLHSEGAGMSLGSLLRAQAQQRTAERHARAERLAMQAPVKLLGPLILCIFPCTFVVISVPIVVRILEATQS